MQVTTGISATMAKVVAHIAAHGTPKFLVEAGCEQGLSAARWHFQDHGLRRERVSHHVLTYHRQSGTALTKLADGRRVRKVPRQGCVTLSRATDCIEWSWDRPLDVVHIYIHPASLLRFATDHLRCTVPPTLHDFFGIEDSWLAGYFQMLISECEPVDTTASERDTDFLQQTEPLLLNHLIRTHSDFAAGTARDHSAAPTFNALRPTVLRRIDEHVHAHLADPLHLASIAAIANMSVDHFLRSFRAACGTTPYQYILGLRLARATAMLRETVVPIATIAAECGFHSASHFSATFSDRFGMRPSQYRRQA